MAEGLPVRNEETGEVINMANEFTGFLYNDRLAPITTSMGLIEEECSSVVKKFVEWREESKKFDHYTKRIRSHTVIGNLEETLLHLLPLKLVQSNRYLLIPTIAGWTAYLDNNYRGTDPAAISYLPELLNSRSVWVVARPHSLRYTGSTWRGREGALVMEVYGHEEREWLNLIRKIRLENDAGKWQFEQSGEPFSFEEKERYQAEQVRDRFDFDLLKRYLKALGLSPFEEEFYLPSFDRSAVLVEITTKYSKQNKDITLEEARRMNGIED